MEDKKIKQNSNKNISWPIKILVLAVFISFFFSVLAELVLGNTGVTISCIILAVLIVISIITDIIGTAVMSAEIGPFRAMAAKKIRGSVQSIWLISNADKVDSILSDVVGDICAIISGACGTAIVMKIVSEAGSWGAILVAASVTAVISGLTIFFKAICKKYAIKNANKVIIITGKFMSLFTRNK